MGRGNTRHCSLTPVLKPEQARQEPCIDRWKHIIASQEDIQDEIRLARHEVHSDVASEAEGNDVSTSSFGFLTDEKAQRRGGCIE